jgi:hypothetical protein
MQSPPDNNKSLNNSICRLRFVMSQLIFHIFRFTPNRWQSVLTKPSRQAVIAWTTLRNSCYKCRRCGPNYHQYCPNISLRSLYSHHEGGIILLFLCISVRYFVWYNLSPWTDTSHKDTLLYPNALILPTSSVSRAAGTLLSKYPE